MLFLQNNYIRCCWGFFCFFFTEDTYQQWPNYMPLKSSVFCCAIRGGEMLKRGGHLLGNLAWAWDVRTSLCDSKLGWMAWLGATAGLGTCATPGWLMGATGPITVPKEKEAAPSTCCPKPLFPEETAVVVWALWAAVPTTVKHKAMGVWDWMLGVTQYLFPK